MAEEVPVSRYGPRYHPEVLETTAATGNTGGRRKEGIRTDYWDKSGPSAPSANRGIHVRPEKQDSQVPLVHCTATSGEEVCVRRRAEAPARSGGISTFPDRANISQVPVEHRVETSTSSAGGRTGKACYPGRNMSQVALEHCSVGSESPTCKARPTSAKERSGVRCQPDQMRSSVVFGGPTRPPWL